MLGTVVNTGSPIVEGELPLDGNRFEGILPPVSTAPVFVIRKRAARVYTLDDYVTAGIVEPWQAEALREAIRTRPNIVIAGGTAITMLDRKSTRLNSSHGSILYAVFFLKKKIT